MIHSQKEQRATYKILELLFPVVSPLARNIQKLLIIPAFFFGVLV